MTGMPQAAEAISAAPVCFIPRGGSAVRRVWRTKRIGNCRSPAALSASSEKPEPLLEKATEILPFFAALLAWAATAASLNWAVGLGRVARAYRERKSTRLNSSHL